MPRFYFRGRNPAGEVVEGHQEAASAGQVAAFLGERQITPILIRPDRTEQAGGSREVKLGRLKLFERVKLDELIMFSRQMYSLTRAGVPIVRAIRGLALSVRNPLLRETLTAVADELEQGVALSNAMHHHPRVFSRLYVSLIHVGENTGNLDQAFLQVAHYLELERNTIKNIKSATRYPLFVILAISIALAIINVFVIPAFAGVFESLGAELPWQTRVLIAISDFTINYWYLIVGGTVVAVTGFLRYINTEEGRLRWDRIKLKLPVVGGLFYRIALGRFCRTFALVLRSGIPIEQSLSVVSGAVGNVWIGRKVAEMRRDIEHGEAISQSAQGSGMFSPLVMQMIAVGEETGNIDEMLAEAAAFYEQEVEYDLKGLAAAIEPILIVAIGIMVLVLALGVFLPLWELNTTVNR